MKSTYGGRLLSIVWCVEGHDFHDIETVLPQMRDMSDDIVVVVPKPPPEMAAPDMPNGIHIREAEEMASAINDANGEWILLLHSHEVITDKDKVTILNLCRNAKGTQAYYFICKHLLNEDDLTPYEWLGNQGKYKSAEVMQQAYVPRIEVRLFKKSLIRDFLPDGRPGFSCDLETIPVANITLGQPNLTDTQPGATIYDNSPQQDRSLFLSTDDVKSALYRDFQFLSPRNIGYSLVGEQDVPSLLEGLNTGFGSIDILKFMVHKLIQVEKYDDAIKFADTVAARLGEDIELWRLKGSAFFYRLDLNRAQTCYREGLEIRKDDSNLMANLARAYIVGREFKKAKALLKKLLATVGETAEFQFLHDAIEENHGMTARLSVMMIARDEEPYIARALKSVAPIADEIIVVDTGSADATTAIALHHGATVVNYPWKDHFADARNVGLSHVTGDYVFCIDADEYLDADGRMAMLVFKNVLPLRNKKAIVLDVKTFADNNSRNSEKHPLGIVSRTTIFPVHPDIRFSGRVFEDVDSSLKGLSVDRIHASNIHIVHQSVNPDIRRTRKSLALMKSFSEPLGRIELLQGSMFWIDYGDYHEASRWLLRAVREMGGNAKYESILCHLMTLIHREEPISVHGSLFTEILTICSHSYRIRSFCAELLCQQEEYGQAAALLKDLLPQPVEPAHIKDWQRNCVNMARAALETDDQDEYFRAYNLLAGDPDKSDSVCALSFYREVCVRDIQKAIHVLDVFIRERRLPINRLIQDFFELILVISEISEAMIAVGQIDAATIFTRSAERLAQDLHIRKGETPNAESRHN